MSRAELADNRKIVKQIDRFLKTGNPEAAVKAADHFIELHAKLTERIVDQGLLDPDQAAKAAVIPFVRVHLGGGYGRPEKLIAEFAFIGEGQQWTRTETLELTGSSNTLIRSETDPPGRFTYKRCDA